MSCKHASSSCDLIRSEKPREVTLGHFLKWEAQCFSRHSHVLQGVKRIIQWVALSLLVSTELALQHVLVSFSDLILFLQYMINTLSNQCEFSSFSAFITWLNAVIM